MQKTFYKWVQQGDFDSRTEDQTFIRCIRLDMISYKISINFDTFHSKGDGRGDFNHILLSACQRDNHLHKNQALVSVPHTGYKLERLKFHKIKKIFALN